MQKYSSKDPCFCMAHCAKMACRAASQIADDIESRILLVSSKAHRAFVESLRMSGILQKSFPHFQEVALHQIRHHIPRLQYPFSEIALVD